MLDSLISAFFVLALIGLVEVAKDIFRLLLGLFAFARRHVKVAVAFALTLLIFALVAIVVNAEAPTKREARGTRGAAPSGISPPRRPAAAAHRPSATGAGTDAEAFDLDNSKTEINEGWEDLEWELPEPPDQSLDEPTTGENTETNAIPDASEDVSTNRTHRFLRLPRWGRKAAPAE